MLEALKSPKWQHCTRVATGPNHLDICTMRRGRKSGIYFSLPNNLFDHSATAPPLLSHNLGDDWTFKKAFVSKEMGGGFQHVFNGLKVTAPSALRSIVFVARTGIWFLECLDSRERDEPLQSFDFPVKLYSTERKKIDQGSSKMGSQWWSALQIA